MLLKAKGHPVPPSATMEEVQVDREKRYKVDIYKKLMDRMEVYNF